MEKPRYQFTKFGRLRLAFAIGVLMAAIVLIVMLTQSIPQIVDMVADAGTTEEMVYAGNVNGVGLRTDYKIYRYGSNVYYVLNVDIDSPANVTNAFSSGGYGDYYLQAPMDLATNAEAHIAINTDDYPYNEGGVIIRNGKLYEYAPTDRDLLLMTDDLTLSVINESELTDEQAAHDLVANGVINSYTAGPALIVDGEITSDVHSADASVTARTGIGMRAPGEFTIVVCDGLTSYSPGLSLSAFAQLFEEQGCSVAYALGDDSDSVLIVDNEVQNDNAGRAEPRMVGDMLCFIDDRDLGESVE